MNKIQRLSITLIALLMASTTWAYHVKVVNGSGYPVITAKNGETEISESTDVIAGSTITLSVAEDASRYITKIKIEALADAGSANAPRRAIEIQGDITVRTVTEYRVYEFTMPNYDVKILVRENMTGRNIRQLSVV